jgi:hypothetical protein
VGNSTTGVRGVSDGRGVGVTLSYGYAPAKLLGPLI